MSGVAVALYDSVDGVIGNGNDVLVASTTTGNDGAYQFTDPRYAPSGYYVQVSQPGGLVFTRPNQSDDDRDSDVDAALGRSALFTFEFGNPVLDAGIAEIGSYFNRVLTAGDGPYDDLAIATALDAAGNVYVAGAFAETVDFDPGPGQTLLSNFGGNSNLDTFVAKYSPTGVLLWVKQIGGWRGDAPNALAVDAAGNVVVAGSFIGPIDLDPGPNEAPYNSGLITAAYVCQLDASGNYVWGRMLTGTWEVRINGVAFDAAGNVILAGMTQGTADFGGDIPTLTTTGGYDVLVAKINPGGTFVWADLMGSVNHDEAMAVAVDPAGNIVVTGYYQGLADFDPGPGTVSLDQGLVGSTFVAKVDPTGALVWAKGMGSTAYGIRPGTAITTDAAGNVYTTGQMNGSGDYDPGSGSKVLNGIGLTDVFVTKMDANGGYVWASAFGGTGYDYATGIRVDAAGSVYLSGEFGDYSPTADFDPSPTATFTLTSAGGFDAFVSKLDSAGGFVWARAMGGSGADSARGLVLDPLGTVYAVGAFRTTTAFVPALPGGTRTSEGGSDLFVVRFDQGEVSGVAWEDANRNGLRDDGETLLAGVPVELFDTVDGIAGNGDDRSVGMMTSAANGAYRFTSPANRNCYVVVRPPAGLALVAADQGTDARDSDFDPVTGRTALFTPDVRLRAFDVGLVPTTPVLGFAHGIGAGANDDARVVTSDAAGNVYVAGGFTGTVDFDPSSAEVPLSSVNAAGGDLFVACYDPTGVLLWVRSIGGAALLEATGIGVDAGGSVYLTGSFTGTVDFDPGDGLATRTSVNNSDVFVLKLDATGSLLWVNRLGNPAANDTSGGLALDAAGNVYLAGTFRGTVDFNPGSGTLNLSSAGVNDVFVTKWNASGVFVWAKRFGGADSEEVSGIAVDAAGNVVLAGRFNQTVDFDPGPGTFPLTSASSHDIFLSKLDTAGNFLWARRIGGTSSEILSAVALDSAGSVYFTGAIPGGDIVDFDPGPLTYGLTSSGGNNFYVGKLDAAGQFQWARSFPGSPLSVGMAIDVDVAGNVYTTGYFYGTLDFDPSLGEYALTSPQAGIFVSKLDAAGRFNSAYAFPSPIYGGCTGQGIAVDGSGNIYVAGRFFSTIDVGFGAPNQTLTGVGNDIFLARLRAVAEVNGVAWLDANGNGFRDSGEDPLAGVIVELFDTADGIAGNGNDRSLGLATTLADGGYRFADPPGAGHSYSLVVRLPGGYVLSSMNGGDDAHDNDFNPWTGRSDRFARSNAVQTFDVGVRLEATAPVSGFAEAMGGSGADDMRSLTRDDAGNVYLAGTFRGSIDLDPGPGEYWLTSAGGTDLYVASYTAAGALRWAYRLGGSGDDLVGGLAVAADGAQYLSGSFRGTVDFDPGPEISEVTSAAGADVFVIKVDASHALRWVRRIGGGGDESASGLALAPGGAVLLTGDFPGTVDFDPGTGTANRTSLGARDAFVWRLDRDGGFVWVRQLGGLGTDDTAAAVATDGSGAVYVTGAFRGAVDFDPGSAVRDLRSAGERDVYLWKLDAAGSLVWARQAGGSGDDLGLAVAAGPIDTVAVGGSFRATAVFDPGGAGTELTAAGDTDAFVWTVNATGAGQWARGFGGVGSDGADAVRLDAGGVYLAGAFQDTADFDPGSGVLSLTSEGGTDGFLVRLDLLGNRQWARRVGGTNDDRASGVVETADGAVLLAGTFTARASFDPGDGEVPMTGPGLTDLYLAGLTPLAAGGTIPLDANEPNGSRSDATNLGVINTAQTVAGLTLHAPGDEDWFRFDLLIDAEDGNRIRLIQTDEVVSARLELYAGASLVGSYLTSGAVTTITLDAPRLSAGTYHLRIFDASAPGRYRLTFDLPRALPADSREANDTAATASDLGTLRDVTSLPGLTIHAARNDDWFRFSTVAAGSAAASVRIDFRNGDGDLDVELYDSLGTTRLREASGATNVESISLAGLAAGTYFVRVLGHNGDLNPFYTLTVTPPAELLPDRFEANGTRLTAKPLGNVQGTRTWDTLSIHTGSDADWFSFTTDATSSAGHLVRIDFLNVRGDLDLRLFDSAGGLLATAAGANDGEQLSLSGLAAGTYYVQVSGYNGAVQPSYQLTLVAPAGAVTRADRLDLAAANNTRLTATPLRNEGSPKLAGVQTLTDLNVHAADQDWFTFTTVGKSGQGHSLLLASETASGQIDLELYTAAGVRIGTSAGAGGLERLGLNGLAAGTYFVRVWSPQGATGGYSLTVDVPTVANRDDWTILVYMTADNLVDRAFADLNEMELAASRLPGSVNFAVLLDQSAAVKTFPTGNGAQPAWGTTGRGLITPDTEAARVATRFELLAEQNTGSPAALRSFVQWATTAAPADHYALVLWDHGGGLRGFNYDKSDGLLPDWLTPTEVTTALAGLPRMEVVAFDACFMASAEVAYSYRGLTDVVVGSQDVIPGSGFDYAAAFATLATNPAGATAEILATGLVQSYARQYGSAGSGSTLSAVRTAGLSPLIDALAQFGSVVAASSPTDRAQLTTLAARTLLPNPAVLDQRDLGGFFTRVASQGTLDDALEAAARSVLSCLDDALLSRTSDDRGSSGLSVYLPVMQDGGQTSIDPEFYSAYPSQYGDFAAASSWLDLLQDLAGSGGSRPDEQDSYDSAARNDVFSAASDLRRLSGPGHVYDGLSLHDETDRDWYRFQIDSAAGASLQVTVSVGAAASAPLTVVLRNAAGQPVLDGGGEPVSLSPGSGQSGTLTLTGLPAGPGGYTLSFQSSGAVPEYEFTIQAPGGGLDWAGGNETAAKAYPLDPQAGGALAGLVLGSGAEDWFHFATPVLLTPEVRQVAVIAGTADPLEVQLRDATGATVGTASGTGTLIIPYTLYGRGEGYTLYVHNPGPGTVPYSLRLEPADPSAAFALDSFTRPNGLPGASWAVSGNPIITGQQLTMSGGVSGRAVWQGFTAADVAARARFGLPAAGNATATVFVRTTVVSGRTTGYEGRIVRSKGIVTAQLYRLVNGTGTLLGQAPLRAIREGVLRLDAVGQRIRLLLDGRAVVEATDTVVVPAGLTGVAGTAGVGFDDFLANANGLALPMQYGSASDSTLGGAWSLVAGSFATQDRALVAGATAAATALYTPAWLADVDLSADYNLTSGQTVSLLARHSAAGALRTYYEGRLKRDVNGTVTAALVRVVRGVPVVLANLAVAAAIPASGELRLLVQGNLLQLLVNGTAVARAIDSTIRQIGQIGVSASAGAALEGLSVAIVPLAAPGSVPFSDSFTRPGGTVLGDAWVERRGDLLISGNRLMGQSSGTNLGVWGRGSLLNAVVAASVDLSAFGQSAGLVARYTEAGSYYEARLTRNNGSITAAIYRVTAGVATRLATTSWQVAAIGQLRLEVAGSTLRLHYHGQMLTVTDAVLTGPGLVGVALGTGAVLDEFSVTAG